MDLVLHPTLRTLRSPVLCKTSLAILRKAFRSQLFGRCRVKLNCGHTRFFLFEKMKLSVSVALLLVVVLATATEAGWVRKALGKVGNVAKTVITHETVKGITGIVKGLGPGLVMGAIGKRSVDSQPLQGTAREAKARSLLSELELACTQFSDLQNKRGLNDADLRVAFAETDENKDGRLNSVELDLFENVVDAVQHCLDILRKPQAVQGM